MYVFIQDVHAKIFVDFEGSFVFTFHPPPYAAWSGLQERTQSLSLPVPRVQSHGMNHIPVSSESPFCFYKSESSPCKSLLRHAWSESSKFDYIVGLM